MTIKKSYWNAVKAWPRDREEIEKEIPGVTE